MGSILELREFWFTDFALVYLYTNGFSIFSVEGFQ